MNQWITNEMLALLICWAVGLVMDRLERLECNREPERKAIKPAGILEQLTSNRESNLDERVEAFRIIAQERLKEKLNGNK